MFRPPPISTLFPYTTLFRSGCVVDGRITRKSGLGFAHDKRSAAHAFNAARQHQGSVACTDRKSTRLNSSHVRISYAVFCLKKKKKKTTQTSTQTISTINTTL